MAALVVMMMMSNVVMMTRQWPWCSVMLKYRTSVCSFSHQQCLYQCLTAEKQKEKTTAKFDCSTVQFGVCVLFGRMCRIK